MSKSKNIQFLTLLGLLANLRLSAIVSSNFEIQSGPENLERSIQSICPPGCLKCLDSQCLLCDFYSGYSFQSSSCRPPSDPNCLVQGHSDKCLQCDRGFYFSTVDQVCVELGEDELLEKCEFYSGPLTCIICSQGFSVVNSGCSPRDQVSVITEVDLEFYK